MRPRLLDLFAGAGGCSVGYDRAGFDVVGVDIEPHPDYPFQLIVGDALKWLEDAQDAGKRKCRACVYERNRRRRRENPATPEQHARRMELQRERRARAKEIAA